ncbi:MAG TPA: hypothetical protein G4O00_14500 [Thermoflexia bacterium]|jgi:hypothetical protein|nr:hypothetical protein [Thermoflexia bacterium]
MSGKGEVPTAPSAGRYEVHPDGKGDSSLAALLRRALADFHRRHGRLPTEIVVHPSVVERAREMLSELDLRRVHVAVSGGCLVWEVWLGMGGESDGGQ